MIKFLFVLAVMWGSLQVEAGTFTLATASVQREILTLNFTNTGSLSTVTLSGISLKCGGIPPLGWVLKLQGSNWIEVNYTWCNALPRYISITAGSVQTSTDSIVAVTNYMIPTSTLLALYYFNESQNTSLTLAQHNQQTIRIKNSAPDTSYFGDLIRDTTYTQWSNWSVGLDFLIPQSPAVSVNSRCRSENGLNNATFGPLGQVTMEVWIRQNMSPEPAYLNLHNYATCYSYFILGTDSIVPSYNFDNIRTYPISIDTWAVDTFDLSGGLPVPRGYGPTPDYTFIEDYSISGWIQTSATTTDGGVIPPVNNMYGFAGGLTYASDTVTNTVAIRKVYVNGRQGACGEACYTESTSIPLGLNRTYNNNSRLEIAPLFIQDGTATNQRCGFRGTIMKIAVYAQQVPQAEGLQLMYDSVANSIPMLSGSARSTAIESTFTALTTPSQVYDSDINTMGRPQTLTPVLTSYPTRGSIWYNGLQLSSSNLPIICNASVTFLSDPYSYGTNYATMNFYVSDGIATSRTFTWIIDVTHVNHAPNATTGLSSYVAIGSQVTITLSGTDFDPGDIVNNASITSFPTKGQLYTVGGALIQTLPFYLNGLQVVYKPFINATARTNDSFLFNVSDNHYIWSTVVTYTIVLQFNIQTNNPSGTTYEDQSLPLVFTDTDALNLTTTFVNYVYRLPYHGTLSQTNSTLPYPLNNSAPFNYTPNQDFYGVDNFTFFATNGTSYYASDISFFSITVLSTDDIAYFLTDAQLPVRGKAGQDTANFSILWDDVDSDTTTFQVISICSYGLATNLHADLTQLFFLQGSGDQDPRFKYEGPKFPAIKALWNMSATCGTEGNKTITLSVINEDTTATITRTFYLYCDPSDASTTSSSPAWIVAVVWITLTLLIIICCTFLIQMSGKVLSALAGEKATDNTSQTLKLNSTSYHFKRRRHN